MAFSPAIPTGGIAGLRFLDQTYESQMSAFSRSPMVERDLAYFLEKAGEVTTAEELVRDRRLLRVVLGAYGLDAEIDKGAFVRRVLEEGTLDPRSLANRLADPAWAEMSRALGFGDFGGEFWRPAKREEIAERYRVRQFERAVGDVDVNIRLALNFRREIGAIAENADTGGAAWFRIMGSRPLRTVIEGALGLPDSFGKLNIDRQRDELERRAASVFGSSAVAVFRDPATVEMALSRFLARAETSARPSDITPGSTALALLSTGGVGAAGIVNLFMSRL